MKTLIIFAVVLGLYGFIMGMKLTLKKGFAEQNKGADAIGKRTLPEKDAVKYDKYVRGPSLLIGGIFMLGIAIMLLYDFFIK